MAYLVVREGGAERIVPLGEGEITAGRSRANQVKLATEQASRRHCKIASTEKGGYKVIDGGSSNGTFVNGQRVSEMELREGDSIGVGHSVMVFHDGAPPAAPAPATEGTTAPIPLQDRNVRLLIETIVQAAAAKDLDSFLTTAVDNVIEIAKAERGILYFPEGNDLKPRLSRDAAHQTIPDPENISRTIPRQVLETRTAIYLLDTASESEPVPSRSVSIYQLRTVMCAPLRVGDRILGVLYVDSHAKAREYSGTDLALFEAVANYLALTLENVRAGQDAKKRDEDRRRTLEHENAVLRAALERRRHFIGECPEMKALYETVRKVAPTEATVLVLGDSGTGKEAIAHVIHDLSPRSERPFVVIDCAAIPETLLESELFGYEKGAFTGAASTKQGKIEAAHGGTLFLDEIGELSPALQAKLLRALEQRTLTRVGGVDPILVDIRLVAATNRDLDEMVKQGKFRQDLYFRLKVVSIKLPPLRDRGGDILLLADHFLADFNASTGRAVKGFSEEARRALQSHRWEGNVRELLHRIEQAVILTRNDYISTEDLNLSRETGSFRSLEEARDRFEKSYIVQALARNDRNVTHTADELNISRQHLQNLIKKHEIPKVGDEEA